MARIQSKSIHSKLYATTNGDNYSIRLRKRIGKKIIQTDKAITEFFGMDIEQRATLYKMLFMGIVIAIPLLVWNHYDFQNDWQTFMKVLEESNK